MQGGTITGVADRDEVISIGVTEPGSDAGFFVVCDQNSFPVQ